jgi:coiled-coil domain-containing protein 130
MQGFNMGRYRPYDSDPRKESFNSRTGTHALGKRARKLDSEGVLIVRFELPFNVWCNDCGAHIGQGVRYNAEKSKVDAYYSTPIYAFRCKKACCQTWMEIRTDPKNSRYVVSEGARQQNKEWDPEENGGFPVLDDGTGGVTGADGEGSRTIAEDEPFSRVEKRLRQEQLAKRQSSRLEELQEASKARTADPYTLNANIRRQFRKGKKERQQIEAKDEELRKRIGWHSDLALLADEVDGQKLEEEGVSYRGARDVAAGVGKTRIATPFKSVAHGTTPASTSPSQKRAQATAKLAAHLSAITRKKSDPFRTS